MTRREIMQRVRSKWTKPEVAYYKSHPTAISHPSWLPFSPDFVLDGKAVFVDGAFFHCTGRIDFARLSEFWQEKLVRNFCRDLSRDAFYGEDLLVVV